MPPMAPNRRGNYVQPPYDPIAAAYEAGRADAERIGYENTPALTPGSARRGSGHQVEPDYRSLPRRPPIYPARGARRASTLPVRFDDEIHEEGRFMSGTVGARGKPPPPIPTPNPTPRPILRYRSPPIEPARNAFVESPDSSDGEPEPRERRRERVIGERGRETVVMREGERDESSSAGWVEVIEPSSHAPSESKTSDESVREFPRKGTTRFPASLVNQKVLDDQGYPFEVIVGSSFDLSLTIVCLTTSRET